LKAAAKYPYDSRIFKVISFSIDYEPKATKTHRTKSVLSIEDSLVYQAIADKVAGNNYKRLAENNSFVFGSVWQ
jgi:hypothetical protein